MQIICSASNLSWLEFFLFSEKNVALFFNNYLGGMVSTSQYGLVSSSLFRRYIDSFTKITRQVIHCQQYPWTVLQSDYIALGISTIL